MASHKWSLRYTCSAKDCGNIVSRLRDLSSVCVFRVFRVFFHAFLWRGFWICWVSWKCGIVAHLQKTWGRRLQADEELSLKWVANLSWITLSTSRMFMWSQHNATSYWLLLLEVLEVESETAIPMFHLEQSQLRQMVICSWARSQFFVSGCLCRKTGPHIGCLCICRLPLPIPSQGSKSWLPGCAIILHLCVVYPGSNLAWFFDQSGGYCNSWSRTSLSTIGIKTFVSPRNFCLLSIISMEGFLCKTSDSDDNKHVLQEDSKLSSVEELREPWMSITADLHSEITEFDHSAGWIERVPAFWARVSWV